MLTFLVKERVNYASYSTIALQSESGLSILKAIGSKLGSILFCLKKRLTQMAQHKNTAAYSG